MVLAYCIQAIDLDWTCELEVEERKSVEVGVDAGGPEQTHGWSELQDLEGGDAVDERENGKASENCHHCLEDQVPPKH